MELTLKLEDGAVDTLVADQLSVDYTMHLENALELVDILITILEDKDDAGVEFSDAETKELYADTVDLLENDIEYLRAVEFLFSYYDDGMSSLDDRSQLDSDLDYLEELVNQMLDRSYPSKV